MNNPTRRICKWCDRKGVTPLPLIQVRPDGLMHHYSFWHNGQHYAWPWTLCGYEVTDVW